MSEKKIAIEEAPEKPGDILVMAVVGPGPDLMDLFEIRLVGRGKKRRAAYYVNNEAVTAQVYRDALSTCDKDRYGLMSDEVEPPPGQDETRFS